MSINRRDFLVSGVVAAASAVVADKAGAIGITSVVDRSQTQPRVFAGRPVVISAANGNRSKDQAGKTGVEIAYDMLSRGGDPLDAVIAGVNVVELDPTDQSVGLGGLPNEEGVVELDASCMHGPTKRAGAVGAIQDIATPSLVAKAVMDYTDHIFLVGEGARRFAIEMGFKPQNLLTEESRRDYLRWKANLNPDDAWLNYDEPGQPPRTSRLAPRPRGDASADTSTDRHGAPNQAHPQTSSLDGVHVWYDRNGVPHTYGTINMNAVTANGDIASVTTTSGLSWKIPGRVGDSPIIGAGQYCDNDVGAAGSTGRGEANIKVCGAFLAVEFMRQGMSPEQALLQVMKRVIAMTESRLLDDRGRPYFQLQYYAVNKKGEYAAATAYEGAKFAVCDAKGARLEDCAYLYKRSELPKGKPLSGVLRKP